MLAANVTDDILVTLPIPALTDFSNEISRKYKVRKVILDDAVQFNGCEICQDHKGDIRMDMSNVVRKLTQIPLPKMRRKQEKEK